MRSVTIVFILGVIVNSCLSNQSQEYTINDTDGFGYRIMYVAETWDDAKAKCVQEGAKLAVPKSQEEFQFIQRIVRGMHYHEIVGSEYRLLVWLGIENRQDYKIWRNIDGENIEETGFHKWSGDNGNSFSDNPLEPHCAGVDAINPGLRHFWCHLRQPYICQIETKLPQKAVQQDINTV